MDFKEYFNQIKNNNCETDYFKISNKNTKFVIKAMAVLNGADNSPQTLNWVLSECEKRGISDTELKQKMLLHQQSSQIRKLPKAGKGLEHLLSPFDNERAAQTQDNLGLLLKYGKIFYDFNPAIALKSAIDYAGDSGFVANMPELIAAKAEAKDNHPFWLNKQGFITQSEENMGIDRNGNFYKKGTPVLVVVHGGGLITPDRMLQAYDEGLNEGSVKYYKKEFDDLLEGRLPKGATLPLYKLKEIKEGGSIFPHQFGIVMPYKTAQRTLNGFHNKEEFLNNSLVIARAAGSLNYLKKFNRRTADRSTGNMGNCHPFKGNDASTPQGRMSFICYSYIGLSSYRLDYAGCFVAVAPSDIQRNAQDIWKHEVEQNNTAYLIKNFKKFKHRLEEILLKIW